MHFQVPTTIPLSQTTRRDTCFLIPDKWDDWFAYETMFRAVCFDKNGRKRDIGGVKIGQKNPEGRWQDIPSNYAGHYRQNYPGAVPSDRPWWCQTDRLQLYIFSTPEKCSWTTVGNGFQGGD